MNLDAPARWLETTSLASFVNSTPWVWPASEILHLMGLCLLIGCVALPDLRTLGMGKRLPLALLNRLVLWGAIGFIVNVITGALFFVAMPFQYVHNHIFQLKVLLIVLAGVNLGLFYATGIFREVRAMGPGDDAPGLAKVIAATSLVLWVGVLYLGRMLPYLGDTF